MATFTPRVGLDEAVARMVAPKIGEIAQRVAAQAKKRGYAPRTKTWNTQGDALVRPWHRSADGQEVPENLKFKIEHSPRRGVAHPPGFEFLDKPRDPRSHRLQKADCRCYATFNPTGMSALIQALPPVVQGSRVIAKVVCLHERAADAEFGDGMSPGKRFMGRAVQVTAKRMR